MQEAVKWGRILAVAAAIACTAAVCVCLIEGDFVQIMSACVLSRSLLAINSSTCSAT
jgi:hypothetical protein